MKKDLIAVDYNDMSINLNFEQAESYLKKELKKYDVVVTQETLKGCKTLSTDLNKIAGEIDTKRKAELATMTAPIKEFDAKMKSLVTLCKEGRSKITEQVKVFEDETRAKVEDLLKGYRESLWHGLKVSDKFKSAEFDDLIIISNMTKTGLLAGKAKTELERRVSADKGKQDLIEKRLLVLENESYKAGLTTPLEETHVRAFLYADDEVYNSELQALLDVEVKRQAAAKAKIEQETADRVKRETAAAAVIDSDKEKAAEQINQEAGIVAGTGTGVVNSGVIEAVEETIEKPVATEGNTFHVIQARFEVSVPSHIPSDRIVAKLKKVMLEAGITSLKEIKAIA